MAIHKQMSAIVAIGLTTTIPTQSFAQSDGYMNNQILTETVQSIANSSEHAWVETIGQSLDGNPIHLITLAGTADSANSHPALLITAGIDGRHLVGTETATRIAQAIIADHSDVLDSMTIYIIPRLNPDGARKNLESLTMGYQGNSRAIDDDRDRVSGEDGPDDLNGDGIITIMRRLNLPIEDQATHLADPEDPRLNIKPDTTEGQRASFTLYPEGLDNDGDGQINEDGFGNVNLDQNFMHDWPEYATHSGKYQLSEPESNAIAKFVLAHDNIVMAVTFGSHDNLVNSPDSKKKNITGRAPIGIDIKDAEMYTYAGELYKEATDQKTAPNKSIAGSFHAWLYAQRGIPSFATVVWTRPEIEKKEAVDDTVDDTNESPTSTDETLSVDDSGLQPSGIGDIAQVTIDELMAAYEALNGEPVDESMIAMVTPEMIEGFAAQAGIEIQRVKATETADEPVQDKKSKKNKKSDDALWLEYFDETGIKGFVNWEAFDHPTLGAVEIGGFLPLSKINPPADQLDSIAEKQTSFILKLIDSRPQVSIIGPQIKEIADGLYEIRVAIVNDGKMPTSTMYSQITKTIRPIVVRLSSEVDSIITGQRVSRVWGIDANGGRSEHRWIIRSKNIQTETIEIIDPRFGNQTLHLGN